MQPDKELDGVHESKGEEREGGSDEVEEGEAGEDQVCCQLVIFRVTVRRGEKISLFFLHFGKSLRCHLYMNVRKVARVMRNGTEEKVKLARAHSLAIQRRTLISPPRIASIALINGISQA